MQLPPSVAIQNAQIKNGKARAAGTATIKKQRPISSVFSLLSAIWVHMASRWGGDDSEGSAAEKEVVNEQVCLTEGVEGSGTESRGQTQILFTEMPL